MGIRPHFYLVVGVDDITPNDRRYEWAESLTEEQEEILWERELKPEEYWRSTENDLFDDWVSVNNGSEPKIYLGESIYEGETIPVVGFIIEKGDHDSKFIRALAAVDKKWEMPGYELIPTLDPETHKMLYNFYGYNEHDVKCNRFVTFVLETYATFSRITWLRALHYLKLAGWNFKEEELKYILVWDWM